MGPSWQGQILETANSLCPLTDSLGRFLQKRCQNAHTPLLFVQQKYSSRIKMVRQVPCMLTADYTFDMAIGKDKIYMYGCAELYLFLVLDVTDPCNSYISLTKISAFFFSSSIPYHFYGFVQDNFLLSNI